MLAAPSAENAALSETYAKSEVIAESRIQPPQGRVRPRGSEPAGADLTPSAAAKLGLRKYENKLRHKPCHI